jgi:hypothetical protein
MKKLITILLIMLATICISQENKVDLFDYRHKIIKLNIKEKDIENHLLNYKPNTIYIQGEVDGKMYEIKLIRRKNKQFNLNLIL